MTQLQTAAPEEPVAALTAPDREEERTVASRTRDGLRAGARRPGLLASVAVLVLVALWALVPSWFAPMDPLAATANSSLLPPSREHWFGTDQIGRDLYTRVVHGSRLSLSAAGLAVVFGLGVGTVIGLVAGFFGGWVDAGFMRFVDVLLAVPGILLSLALIAALGFGTLNVAIAVGAGSVASCARIMRSQVLSIRSSDFVEAAYAGGGTKARVLLRHVLPNSVAPVLVLITLDLGTAILAVSSLSFLGFGAQPPTPEWGALVSQGRDFLVSAWWLTTLPGLTVVLTVLASNHISRTLSGRNGATR